MQFDDNKLRGRIREVYGTETLFAQDMGLSRTSISLRLNNLAEFSSAEMVKAADLLSFPLEEIHLYFFTPMVQKSEQITQ